MDGKRAQAVFPLLLRRLLGVPTDMKPWTVRVRGPGTEWRLRKIRGGNVLEVWVSVRQVPVPVGPEKERRTEL